MHNEEPTYWVFYHSADLDGHCSGAICRYFLEEMGIKPVMRGINYGGDFPFEQLCPNDKVYMVDFCLQPEHQMQKLKDMCEELIWIDHHESSIKALNDFDCSGIQVIGTAGCELCWGFFTAETPIPQVVKLLGRYDVWDQSNKGLWRTIIYPFQMGMRLYDMRPESNDNMAEWRNLFCDRPKDIETIANKGKVVERYQVNQNERLMYSSFEIDFDDKQWIAVNAVGNSQIFESKYDPEKHHGMLGFSNKGGKYWTVSLYSTRPDVDVSEIAKRNGGGGHKGAAGFQCADLPFPVTKENV